MSLLKDLIYGTHISSAQYQHNSPSIDEFNVRVMPHMKSIDQKNTGSCWIYSTLNILRRDVVKKFNIPDFEFSYKYIQFWDRYERLLSAFDMACQRGKKKLSIDELKDLIGESNDDDGYWEDATNIIRKYGLVPLSIYPESLHSTEPHELNIILKEHFCNWIIKQQKLDKKDLNDAKKKYSEECYKILSTMLGEPPTEFDFYYRAFTISPPNGIQVFGVKTLYNLTPLEFLNKIGINVDDYVILTNDPRKGYNKTYISDLPIRIKMTEPVKRLNMSMKQIIPIIATSLQGNNPVWFTGCIDRHTSHDKDVMDIKINYGKYFNVDTEMTKKDELIYGISKPNHAMVLVGCQINEDGQPSKWLGHNTWGSYGRYNGHIIISNEWFQQYTYHYVVNKKYLSKDQLILYNKKPIKSKYSNYVSSSNHLKHKLDEDICDRSSKKARF